ncbi:MAG: response regulator [Hyphomicrobiaceae bacterium]
MARILIADDDIAARDIVQRALEADGHAVQAAQDGQEALDHLGADPAAFDLVISDVQMPVLDGIAMVERALALSPTLKAIVMSGFAGGLSSASRLPASRVSVLEKPVRLDALRAAIVAALA